MVCPHCGERALAVEQRYCHACGALVGGPAPAAGGHVVEVEDGSRRAAMPIPSPALDRAVNRRGRVLSGTPRLLLWGAGLAVAVVAMATVIIALVSALVAVVAMLAPIAVVLAIIYLVMRPRRRRRYRYRYWSRF